MTAILHDENSAIDEVLYIAFELSNKKWKLGFCNGKKTRQITIEAGDLEALTNQIALAKEKLKLDKDCSVRSCYEAGRDGHSFLPTRSRQTR